MGMRHSYTAEEWKVIEEGRKTAAAERLAKQEQAVRRLATRISGMVTDLIVNDIIRPGPVAEERECYDMANEMRNHRPQIDDLVAQILVSERVFEKG